jgi:DNA-binding transcriptional MerR regulator
MASYATRVVERLFGLPSSTLRHWEREVPLLQPRKDVFGRRLYSEADLRLILRLKHFALDQGLGLSAARARLLEELSGPMPDERARIEEVRGELIELLAKANEAGKLLMEPKAGRTRQERRR